MVSVFPEIKNDYYVRSYKVNPALFPVPVTLYLECTVNQERINGHFYWLDIYFSADNIGVRDYIVGVSFGESELDREAMDAEMDTWALNTLMDDFASLIRAYMDKEDVWCEELERRWVANQKDKKRRCVTIYSIWSLDKSHHLLYNHQ